MVDQDMTLATFKASTVLWKEFQSRARDQSKTATDVLRAVLQLYLDGSLDELLDGVKSNLDSRIDNLDERIDKRIDAHLDELIARISDLEDRLDEQVKPSRSSSRPVGSQTIQSSSGAPLEDLICPFCQQRSLKGHGSKAGKKSYLCLNCRRQTTKPIVTSVVSSPTNDDLLTQS